MLSRLQLSPANKYGVTHTLEYILDCNISTDFTDYRWSKSVCSKQLMFGYISEKLKHSEEVSSVLIKSKGNYVTIYACANTGAIYKLCFRREDFSSSYNKTNLTAGEYMKKLMKDSCTIAFYDTKNVGYALI